MRKLSPDFVAPVFESVSEETETETVEAVEAETAETVEEAAEADVPEETASYEE